MNGTNDQPIIYRVHVEHQRVSIEAIDSRRPEYEKAHNQAVKRLREAMEIERKMAEKGDFSDETHYFSVLQTAREFAELIINDISARLNDDYSAVEKFEG